MTGTQRAQSLGLTRHGQLITVQDAGAADGTGTTGATISITRFLTAHGRKACCALSLVAAAAVDLLAVQMSRFERGVHAVPRQVLNPSAWVDGDSVPTR
jgi:hypothetical protein